MSKSQAFLGRVVKQVGISADTVRDDWNARKLSAVSFDEHVALRIAPLAVLDATDTRGIRSPRSKAERTFSQLYRGTMVDLDIDTIDTESHSFYGAVDLGPYETHSRVTLDLTAYGQIPELDHQKVAIRVFNLVMHRPSSAEHEGGIFVNQARIIPYTNSSTV